MPLEGRGEGLERFSYQCTGAARAASGRIAALLVPCRARTRLQAGAVSQADRMRSEIPAAPCVARHTALLAPCTAPQINPHHPHTGTKTALSVLTVMHYGTLNKNAGAAFATKSESCSCRRQNIGITCLSSPPTFHLNASQTRPDQSVCRLPPALPGRTECWTSR